MLFVKILVYTLNNNILDKTGQKNSHECNAGVCKLTVHQVGIGLLQLQDNVNHHLQEGVVPAVTLVMDIKTSLPAVYFVYLTPRRTHLWECSHSGSPGWVLCPHTEHEAPQLSAPGLSSGRNLGLENRHSNDIRKNVTFDVNRKTLYHSHFYAHQSTESSELILYHHLLRSSEPNGASTGTEWAACILAGSFPLY